MKALESKKRVLVLDKDTRLMDAVDDVLALGGWDVSITFDPNAVYDLAKEQQPDLVILDYLLIDNNCNLICNDFKEDPELRSVPIIIVTAYKNRKVKAAQYHCDALFVKPLDVSMVASRIDYLLAS